MLRELRIKNFAVIDELSLELSAGLNVLTGETGAGKSIILSALGLVTGERVGSEIIRHGEEEASVEALFDELPQAAAARLTEAGCEVGEELIVKRVVSRSGKNRVYLGGSLSPLALLAEVGRSLVHVYGQHEHHTLLHPEAHLQLLDAYGGLAAAAAEHAGRFRALAEAWEAVAKARALLEQRRRQRGMLEAQVEEIEKAQLRPGEEEELVLQKSILANAERLYQGCLEGEDLLYEGEDALISRVGRYANKLRELARIDASLQPAVDLLAAAMAHLEEANGELRRYGERVAFEPGALERLEDRLAEIQRLKRKYGGAVPDILRVCNELRAELEALDRGEEELPELEKKLEAARSAAWKSAEALSLERRRLAGRMQKELERECRSLGMPGTIFQVRFLEASEKTDEPPFVMHGRKITEKGADQVEFYFSPNPGEPPKPLARTASGGELSRLMLAIKSLVLLPGDIPTLLFDEVDAGIGGAIAEVVGKKLKQVASTHQVLCVTHLPQIAALADSHHAVRKEVRRGRTSTRVEKLDESRRIEEIARMLGGIKITERTRRHAEEMVRGR
ncbi:MAG TPA: DNA repair protein RecN [candidate division Zixibacteria bacterium]|nr:DNA repair protein RecN [candidate division Zixibacteria bacterium]